MSQSGSLNNNGGGGGVVPITPLKTISDFDDFLSFTDGNQTRGPKLGWISVSNSWSQSPGLASNPGIMYNYQPDTASDAIILDNGPTSENAFLLGGCALNSNWVVSLATLSDETNRYISYIGLSDDSLVELLGTSVTQPENGCFFKYSDNINSGNWQIVCGAAGVYTTVNTSVAATTGFHNFGISVSASGNSATFTIDGAQVGTVITTNIPTTIPVGPSILLEAVTGNITSIYLDLYYYFQTLNVARPGTQTTWPNTGTTGGFTSINVQTFTSNGVYNPTAGMKYCQIECVGGGAGGGGTVGNGSSFYCGGGGGGGGSYSKTIADAATIGASQPVTIGPGGTGGAANGVNNGGDGGDTSLGVICIAKGGSGGLGGNGNNSSVGGAGGIVGTGDLTFPGNSGGVSSFQNPSNGTGRTSSGGNSFFGQGAPEYFYPMTGYGPGLPGTGYGGAGGGGLSVSGNATTSAGGDGSAGVVIITEYI